MPNIYYIDIPTEECVGNPDGAWKNVTTLRSKRKAIAFIREHFGPCDKDGKISLLTTGQGDTPHISIRKR